MTEPKHPKTWSRVDRPDFLHLRPASQLAAESVTLDELQTLLRRLDIADENFDRGEPRAAILESLSAVVEFLQSLRVICNARFWRPVELLRTELEGYPAAPPGRVLPIVNGGSGGLNSQRRNQRVKAAAACAVEFLHVYGGLSVPAAEAEVASMLTERSFPFSKNRNNTTAAVHAWRRDYRSDKKYKADKQKASYPVRLYHKWCAKPPIHILEFRPNSWMDTVRLNADAIRGWLEAEIRQAGYGAVK
jgi:hypothetical protein